MDNNDFQEEYLAIYDHHGNLSSLRAISEMKKEGEEWVDYYLNEEEHRCEVVSDLSDVQKSLQEGKFRR